MTFIHPVCKRREYGEEYQTVTNENWLPDLVFLKELLKILCHILV